MAHARKPGSLGVFLSEPDPVHPDGHGAAAAIGLQWSDQDWRTPRPASSGYDVEALADALLESLLGSAANVGVMPRENARTIVGYFLDHGVPRDQWAGYASGIDLHTTRNERAARVWFEAGQTVLEYVERTRPESEQIGSWFVMPQGAVSHRNLGVSGANRVAVRFVFAARAEALRSRAAPAFDLWTDQQYLGRSDVKPHRKWIREGGRLLRIGGEQVAGGGTQYFLYQARQYLRREP
jgi:hypothetical protein